MSHMVFGLFGDAMVFFSFPTPPQKQARRLLALSPTVQAGAMARGRAGTGVGA